MGILNFKSASGAERPSILHWHEPGTSKEEKWLIRKLDIFILTYSCLCFFIKYLDQTNISNAYVSGMKEELGLYGNELNLMTTYYNIGYIIGAPISNLLLTVVAPRIHLPACLLTWSVFVLALFRAQAAAQIYALRFFIGLFESAALPGLHYVIGSWYRRSELGRRSAFFVISGVLGQMFSGLWSLTCGSSVQTWMALWLKSEKKADGTNRYSVPEINNIPTVVGAVNFVFMTGSGIASDIIGSRAPVMLFVGILMTFCYAIYVIWPSSTGLKMAAFFLQGCYGCFSPLLSGWVNSLCGGDNQLRAFTMAMMMSVGSAFSTPFSQYMFPANDAPTYRKTHGYIAALVFVVALTLWCSVVLGGVERWYYKKQAQARPVEEGSAEPSLGGTEAQQKSDARQAVTEVS
ncbi:Methyltransferase type 11 [Macrophomina phaseolina MS6]|uniref:Methyltransferase type 11 n=1 Tax=Macrophomina phaseolina (strain MS6) TaxID=1126212 RepID=K2S0C0_MACPH|nr:Methyltransferase type 11 [Macrophomina phaseolina MS6]